jgi:hypothetical protein
VNERELVGTQDTPKGQEVPREVDQFPDEQEPSTTPICARPNVGESSDRPGMDRSAGLGEGGGCGPWWTKHMGLEAVAIEALNEVTKARG